MELEEITDLERRLVKSIKRSCLLCHARRAFHRSKNPEKEIVQASLSALAEIYENKFNALRRKNSTPEKIQAALANKRLVLDAIDTCRACDMQVDRGNRAMSELK